MLAGEAVSSSHHDLSDTLPLYSHIQKQECHLRLSLHCLNLVQLLAIALKIFWSR